MKRIKPWREIRTEPVADCRIFRVERSVAVSPEDGAEHDYYRVLSNDWVHIVPVTAAEEIVMVRQFRHGSSTVVLEIPGGLVNPGEDPAAAAVRECLEETGYAVGPPRRMGDINPNPAIHAHRLHSFCARDARPVAEVLNSATEVTEVELLPLAELETALREGRIDHSLVAATLWQFLHEYV